MQPIANITPTYGCNHDIVFYNMVGNFIPPEWRELTTVSGKALSKTARQLLSLIVSCIYASTDNIQDELQESYYFFEQAIGVCQRRVRQCLLELEKGGFITLRCTTIIIGHTKCRNTLCIRLAKKFQPYAKEISGEAEKTFSPSRNNFQPHHIIDNNISMYKSRSSEANLEKNKKNDFVQLELTDCQQEQCPEAKHQQVETDTDGQDSSNWLKKVAGKARDWYKGKKLSDFHPLTKEDAGFLRISSGREFNLNFINKLLMKLAQQYPDHSFYSKKSVLNYMTKALIYEMREASKVNNDGFRFGQEAATTARERYLEKVEYSKDTSQHAQLKRKIAAVFEPDIAYQLLTNCCFMEPKGNCYQLKLLKDIAIPQPITAILLREVQAVYGNHIGALEILPARQSGPKPEAFSSSGKNSEPLSQLDPESIWFKVRQCLIEQYGAATDKSWFSKLEAIEEDKVNKKVILKPLTGFIRSWIKANYERALREAFQAHDFAFEIANV